MGSEDMVLYNAVVDSKTEKMIENWFTYHSPINTQPRRYETIRRTAKDMARVIAANCPPCEDRDQAFRSLRDSVMWANASIAVNESK